MRVSGISWGIIFVGCGVFLLAINAGYLDHYVWVRLLSLWPVALIAIGISLIFKRTDLKYLALLAPLIIALAFVYVGADEWNSDREYLSRYDFDYSVRNNREVFKYVLDKDPEVQKLDIRMNFNIGEFQIGSTPDELINGDFEYMSRKPEVNYEVVRGEGKLKIKSQDHRGIHFFGHNNIKNYSRVNIANYLPLVLDLDMSAAKIDLDLSDHQLTSLKMNTGAAEINLRLGCKSPDVRVEINAGASEINIIVPRDMALEIDSDGILSDTNFRSMDLEKANGKYRSKNFGSASCVAHINIDSGVSEIKIEYY